MSKPIHILGLNAYHGDSSAALLSDGQLVAAVEEERYNRIKHWAGLPVLAAAGCLRMGGAAEVAHVSVSRDPKAHLLDKAARLITHPSAWRSAKARTMNSARIARIGQELAASVPEAAGAQVHFVEHHRAHMASAFFASPFEEAAVVSIDGFGDFSSVMWGLGRANSFDVRGSTQFPHSLGLFYTAFTQFLGFPNYGDEYKMMGLSAYGDPRFRDQVRDVVRVEDGQVRLNLDYFRHHNEGVEMTWEGGQPTLGPVFSQKLSEIFGPARAPRSELTERDRDLAASVQAVLEETYFAILNFIQKRTGQKTVCLAGGVALNCVANGMLFERTDFRNLYVQPAAHDAGTSFGAALYTWHQTLKQPRSYVMRHVYYGAEFDDAAIRQVLNDAQVNYHALSEEELLTRTAAQIADGRIVGWFQGRMEFGPRALGARSILADPRRKDMKDILNQRIKYREPFRPFCPSILAERCGDYFETDYPSPFMVVAYKIKPAQREKIPAVAHADGTGRLQTVEKEVSPLYWNLIRTFEQMTGVPVLINTSFNENEPIVATPEQALDCFLRTQMDVLAIGRFLLLKTENQSGSEKRRAFAETN